MTGSRRRDENSGLIDLDALLKEASEPQLPRADDSLEGIATPQPSAPEPPRRVEPESPSRTKPVEPIAVIKSVPPPPAPPPEAASPAPMPPPAPAPARALAPAPPQRRRSFPVVLVAIGAVAALVALLVFRGPTASPPRTVAQPTPVATEASPAPPIATTSIAHVSEGTLDAKDLPAAPTASASSTSTATAPHPTTVAIAKVTTVALPDMPTGERGDLGGAMREAVGPREAAEGSSTEVAIAPGARQVRPSPGAVVGAINSVMPAARACLGPDDPVRSATIVFRSDGTVARVDIAGERDSDACVRAALSRARVAPFIDDTFAARATVRP